MEDCVGVKKTKVWSHGHRHQTSLGPRHFPRSLLNSPRKQSSAIFSKKKTSSAKPVKPPPSPSPSPSPGRFVRSSPFFFLASGLPFPPLLPYLYDWPAASVPQKRKAPEPGDLRRSGRVASLPEQPNYHINGAQQRDYRGVYEACAVWKGPTDEQRAGAISKAEELQRRTHRSRCPAFVKPMTHSLAINAIYMLIPTHFLKYLPAHDEAVVLVDEADDEFHMMYNAHTQSKHNYLEKGWKGFAFDHDLVDGDCLVFYLIDKAKFKVYIFRANPDYESDQTSDDSEDEE